jgi:probable O-glycosylation ligase (exosortase A-associated)
MQLDDTNELPRASSALRPAREWWRPQEANASTSDVPTQIGAEKAADGSAPFVAVLIFTFVLVVSPQSFVPWLGVLRPAWLAAVSGIAVLLFDRLPKGKPLFVPGRETWAVAGLVAWAILTLPFSYWPGGSFTVLTERYSKTVVIFWLLGLTVNSVRRLNIMAWALSLMAIPLAQTGVSNYLSGNFITGGAASRIAGYQGALTDNPNDLALALNMITPLAIGLLSVRRRLLERLLLLTIVMLNLAVVVFTRSRGGFLSMGALGLFYAWKLMRKGRPDWLFGTLMLVVLCIPLLPEGYLSRMSSITNVDEDETGSAQGRRDSMIAGAGYVLEHPIIGDGIGMNALALNELGDLPTWHNIHCAFLEIGMDLGLPGLFLYLLLMTGAFRSTSLVCRRTASVPSLRGLFHLSEGVQGSLWAFVVGGFFSPVAYHFYFYYFAALAVGARQALEAAQGQRVSNAEAPR